MFGKIFFFFLQEGILFANLLYNIDFSSEHCVKVDIAYKDIVDINRLPEACMIWNNDFWCKLEIFDSSALVYFISHKLMIPLMIAMISEWFQLYSQRH
jgi:hypothetical protein